MGQSRGFIFGIILGAAVTAGLFLLMDQLIKPGDQPPPEPNEVDDITVTREEKPPKDPETKDRLERPDTETPPDVPPKPISTRPNPDRGDDVVIKPGTPDVKPPTGVPPLGQPTPIIRVAPAWPRSEQRDGDVTLEFTITEDGNVTDIQVIDATSQAFARAATRAVSRWRYNPRIENGVPVAQTGVRVTIEFRLEEDE